ncbi:MAG: M48 family metalloprotease, partial [Nitrospirota bacterium]
MNTMKTMILMVALTVLVVFAGSALGGQNGAVLAFAMATIMNFGMYWFSDKIVLKMYGAKQVTEQESPELYRIVRDLTMKANLPMPKVYIMDNPAANAFATGRNPNHAAVAVTTGILNILDKDELSGVLGHELAHIKHRDILIGTIAATMAGAISMLANMAQWAMIFGSRSDRDE